MKGYFMQMSTKRVLSLYFVRQQLDKICNAVQDA